MMDLLLPEPGDQRGRGQRHDEVRHEERELREHRLRVVELEDAP